MFPKEVSFHFWQEVRPVHTEGALEALLPAVSAGDVFTEYACVFKHLFTLHTLGDGQDGPVCPALVDSQTLVSVKVKAAHITREGALSGVLHNNKTENKCLRTKKIQLTKVH